MPIVVSPKRKRKRAVGLNRKTYTWLSISFAFSGVIFYLMFFSGLLGISNVDHNGLSTVSGEEVNEIVNNYLDQDTFFKKRNNIFIVDTNEIEARLRDALPKINEIKVQKKLLHGLLIDLTEKKSQGIYCNKECYYFDESGSAYELAPQTEGFLILNIQDNREKDIALGDTILEKDILTSIYSTRDLFNDLTEIEVRRFIVPSTSFDEFWVETEEDWVVYMTNEMPEKQIEDLSILLKNNFTERERLELEYVDIRLEGRAYYKLRGVDN